MPKNSQTIVGLLVALWVGWTFGWFLVSQVDPQSREIVPQKTPLVNSYSIAEKVAFLDNGTTMGESGIDWTLTLLASKFLENKEHIASMTITGQDMLARRGIHMKLSSLLTAVNYSTEDGTAGMSYAEALAAFVVLRQAQ